MPDYDLLVHGANNLPFVGIADGKIAGVTEGSAKERIDATGLTIFPGVIDAHVHFNEPGRTEWEGFATGSAACAVGGTTMFIDMPLNAHPPTVDGPSFDEKLAAASATSYVDFALWGGLVPANLDQLECLRDRGVAGLKAFMSNSGIDDFEAVDLRVLKSGMKKAAELGLLVAVHAELERTELRKGTSIRDYLDSRPIAIEVDAIRAAIEIAGEAGCALHVVHVSSAEGVEEIRSARLKGVDVTCETCPHYLLLEESDMERLGGVAKCAPPLRRASEREALLDRVLRDEVDTIGSDHSPSPLSMKTENDFYKVWGGISGCQHLLLSLLDLNIPPGKIAGLTSSNVAARFDFTAFKGRIAVGLHADLILVKLDAHTDVTASSLRYRHPHSPYVGRRLRGSIERTILRGQTIARKGELSGTPGGKFMKKNV